MPSERGILGFDNRWQGAAIPHAIARELPSGATIRAVSPPHLLATKLEAFKGRGNRDFLGSRDFSDIIAIVDGHEELVEEVARSPADVRDYNIASQLRDLLEDPRFADGLFGARYVPMPPVRRGPMRSSCHASARSCPESLTRVIFVLHPGPAFGRVRA
jgi:hypothetical protein